jgi:hypothetical protein
MSEETLDYKKHLSLQLGQYFQVHEEDNPRNSQIARTKGAISLGPIGNIQGGFKFMALNNGKKFFFGMPYPCLISLLIESTHYAVIRPIT